MLETQIKERRYQVRARKQNLTIHEARLFKDIHPDVYPEGFITEDPFLIKGMDMNRINRDYLRWSQMTVHLACQCYLRCSWIISIIECPLRHRAYFWMTLALFLHVFRSAVTPRNSMSPVTSGISSRDHTV